MAKLIDKEPMHEGEKLVWHSFSDLLPQDWIIYNTRSVNGREYDFCVMVPEVGLFIVEVKGWSPESVLTVVNENTIFIANKENPEDSPRGQARGYRFDLLKKINRELGMNPLVMSLVCYPLISEDVYKEKGLGIVSETNETIFEEDLKDSSKLFQKFIGRYNVDKGAKHDELNTKRFVLLRHFFEPNYDLKIEVENLNPGYSRLRIFSGEISDDEINEVVEEYFRGIKEYVFVPSKDSMQRLVEKLNANFNVLKIHPEKGNICIGAKYIDTVGLREGFSIFNFEIEVIEDIEQYSDKKIMVEEGECNAEEQALLKQLEKLCAFNFQQYEIEHAPIDKNILVTAGAGTGKTYSMVSRVAFLCNKVADSVVDIVRDIAMITFTNDAAENMNKRVKQMFMNYFVLTSNEKYMHLIEDMGQVQISTIHKFAIELLKKDCMRFGLGYDSQISNETYNRRQLYKFYLNEYIQKKNEENPNFSRQLPFLTYKLEDLLVGFCDKLYDRSVDIKKLSVENVGEPISTMPYFNELIFDVIIKAEKDYANELKDNNLIGLKECMIQIHDLVRDRKLMQQGHNFKYVFVDEFQDTDDVQIETITGLQKLFGDQCRLFIVGDLKQSIYRFRGATLSAFDKVADESGIGEWNYFSLNRNYRTDKRLLDMLHGIFSAMGAKDVLPYNEDTDRLSSRLLKEYETGELVRKIDVHGKNKDAFYEELFKEIKNQIEKLENLAKIKELSPEEKTIAILVRYNYQISKILREVDRNENVDFNIRVTEGGDLYRLASSVDLYKLILAVTHPRNKIYLANLIRSNYVSSKINLTGISGYTKENKTGELIRILDEYFMLLLGKTWNQVVADFESRPVLVVLRDIYEASKPWSHYADEDQQKEYRENYDCLIEKVTRKYSRDYMTINRVCDFLKINITTYQEEASRNETNEKNKINIICTTIHKSKGLEYGTVILPFTNEDLSDISIGGLNVNIIDGKVTYSFSTRTQGLDYSGGFDSNAEAKEKIREEARILYVALTRTIRNLVWLHDIDANIDYSWGNYMEVEE